MGNSFLRIVLTTFAVALATQAFAPGRASALCGDVTGDGKNTTKDALAVLRSAVGQPVELTCEDSRPSRLRYYNDFGCSSGSSVSQAMFNGFTFSADAGESSEFQTVDRESIDTMQIDLCDGSYYFDGPLYLPRNRSIQFFMIRADPAVYQFEGVEHPAFFVLIDLGEPAAAGAEAAVQAPHEIAVIAGGADR